MLFRQHRRIKNLLKHLCISNIFIIIHTVINKANINLRDSDAYIRVQLLCYYSQAWHYTILGEPLIEGDFIASDFGPEHMGIKVAFDEFVKGIIPEESVQVV